jgi:molybdopterin synthase sulfur carrier subunit
VARLRLFAQAREAAGTSSGEIDGATLADVLTGATQRYGSEFARVLAISAVWVNGSPAAPESVVGPDDEVVVLPPVSGGA